MIELSDQQKDNITRFLKKFADFLKTEEGHEWQIEREERVASFKEGLSKEGVNKMSEEDFGKVIMSLWASDIWGNKEYLIGKLLKDNTLPKIKDELKNLLYGSESIAKRFNRFGRNIKGLGPSSITEILAHVFPEKYSMWNVKPKTVLPFLKMKTLLPDRVYKYSISGDEYVKCNEVLTLIRNELEAYGFEKPDFMDVDYFLFFIFERIIPRELPEEKKAKVFPKIPEVGEVKIESHTDAQGILIELGNLLGYETYVADPSKEYRGTTLGDIIRLRAIPGFTYRDTLEIVKKIDVIWFKGEYPVSCFEVEHTTNVRDGLLRLYQISPLKGINFFIIAPSDVYSKFEKEVSRRPFKEIKERYNFKSYEALAEFFKVARIYHKMKDDFFGITRLGD